MRRKKTRCSDGMCGGCDACLAAQGRSEEDYDDEGDE
jgi:hypothetical protein